MHRDLDQLRKEVDLELVLLHYGYQLNTKKSNKRNIWRLYEIVQNKDKHRLVLTINQQGLKFFIDLNDPKFSGDIFKFMERMEQGNYHNIFRILDLIKSKIEFNQNKKSFEPASRQLYSLLDDNSQREKKLYAKYSILSLENTDYLEGRGIAKKVLFAKEFNGCIKNITLFYNKIKHINTAFLMFASDGKMVSIDIRNTNFKAFPEGERGEALWISNPFFMVNSPVIIGEKEEIQQGIIGTIGRSVTENRVFSFGKLGEEKQVYLLNNEVKNKFQELTFHRILISESAIDALSLKQLSPEQPDERRLYVATCGQPSNKQIKFLQEIINKNPQAQLVMAQDNDPAGLRFAINYLALMHPYENPEMKITPSVTFVSAISESKGNVFDKHIFTIGINRLSLEIRYPLSLGVRKAQEENEGFVQTLSLLVSEHGINPIHGLSYEDEENPSKIGIESIFDENLKHMITRATIAVPNLTNVLTLILELITTEIEKRQGQRLFHILCPTPPAKDFNDVLQLQKGEELPLAHPLKLPESPVIRPYYQIQTINSKQHLDIQGFGQVKNIIDF
ncbi:toprim domain-containing protein [Runella aurantiaca]|uniref:Toprim domain-containing protein n=1 Tax=Runella aurantiaca TaxID=2282308 RepID=A0A369I395_9BACT|nr:toprim domain-containing protein [Runella aurantiaca]RDB02735.1 hypothetical protein DVG78_27405 [Runella aurantiaca]